MVCSLLAGEELSTDNSRHKRAQNLLNENK